MPLRCRYADRLILGAVLYGTFIATVTTVMEEANGSAKEYRKRLDMLGRWMRHGKVELRDPGRICGRGTACLSQSAPYPIAMLRRGRASQHKRCTRH